MQAFDKGPWPRMHGRERGQILYKLADLMEVRCSDIPQEPEILRAMSRPCCVVALLPHCEVGTLHKELAERSYEQEEVVDFKGPTCLQENLEELAMLESLDNGKPLSASKGGDLPQVTVAGQCTAQSSVKQEAFIEQQNIMECD